MAEPKLSLFHVGVQFNPLGITDPLSPLFVYTLNGTFIPPDETMVIPVPSGVAMIVFNLSTAEGFGSEKAHLQTSPLQWFGTDQEGGKTNTPAEVPGMFSVERQSENVIRLLDFNSNMSNLDRDKNHWFNLVVAYNGQTYGSDPSIVNQPPD